VPQAIKDRDVESEKQESKSTYIPQPPPRDPQISIFDVVVDSEGKNPDSEKESE